MSQPDDRGLPPELSYVADQLRSHRYAASDLELDEAKRRILKHASGRPAARGGAMRLKTLLTAVITFAAIGTGSAAALAVAGVPVPFISHEASHAARSHPSAAIAQYGKRDTTTRVFCRPSVIRSGRSTTCTALVIDQTTPTGTVSLSAAGQTQTCVLMQRTRSSSLCRVTFTASNTKRRPRRVRVTGRYSGDATHNPSSGSGRFVVIRQRHPRPRA